MPSVRLASLRRFAAVVLAAVLPLLAVAPRTAHADDGVVVVDSAPVAVPPPVATAEPPRTSVVVYYAPAPPVAETSGWYGGQTLATDAASGALVGLGVAINGSSSAALALTGLSGFALGAPIVHAVHGRWGVAAADLGLRVGAVIVGSLLGARIGTAVAPASCNAQFLGCLDDTMNGLLVGALVGAATASTIDAAVLAREPGRPSEAPAPAVAWSPSVSMVKSGATAGLRGTF